MKIITKIDVQNFIDDVEEISIRLSNTLEQIDKVKNDLDFVDFKRLGNYLIFETNMLKMAYKEYEDKKEYFSKFNLENDYNEKIKKCGKAHSKLSETLVYLEQEKIS